MRRAWIVGWLVQALAATAVAAGAPSPREKMFADLVAETQAVREDAGRRLTAAPDLTDDEVRGALGTATDAAKPVLLRVVAARRMNGLVPEVAANLVAPDPATADAAVRALVGLGDDAVATGLAALAAANDADAAPTRIHLQALAAQRAVEREIVGGWRRKGGMYKGRYSGLAKFGWPVQPVLLAMLLDVPLADHHLVLPEIKDPNLLFQAKFAELADIFLADRRGYSTFEALPPQIEPGELFDLAVQALKDVADIELMGDILKVTSERLEEIDKAVGFRLRRVEQAYYATIDEVLHARGRPARLERLRKERADHVRRARIWVDRAEGEARADTLGQLSVALSEYAGVLHQLGRFDEAAELFSEVIAIGREFGEKDPAISGYNRACALAQAGRKDEAIKQLARALDRNLSSGSEDLTREWVTEDGDLRALHDDPRFQALIKRRYGE